MNWKDEDTVVVPAREDAVQKIFKGEQRWRSIQINEIRLPYIKHLAVYTTAPVSAITHIAPVVLIEEWRDGKYVLNFSEPGREIGPIPMRKGGRVKQLQNIRYTSRERLEKADTLDDVW
jgi:hypothetical protein